MSKNKLVYSTNPNLSLEEDEEVIRIESSQQKLRIRLETKHRAGKKASIVQGFQGPNEDLVALSKTLKTKLGVGGSVKDGEILIQGDYKDKIKDLLQSLGYSNTK